MSVRNANPVALVRSAKVLLTKGAVAGSRSCSRKSTTSTS